MIDLLWLVAFIILNILVFYTRTIEAFFKKKKHLFYLNLPLEIVKVYIKLFFNIKRFFLIEIIPFLKWCFYRFFTGRGTFYNFDLFNDFNKHLVSINETPNKFCPGEPHISSSESYIIILLLVSNNISYNSLFW